MKYDDIVTHLGDFGPYQKRLYVLIGLPIASLGVQMMLTIFTLGVPDHRCALPSWENDTFAIQDNHHKYAVNASIPAHDKGKQLYSSCLVYDASNNTLNASTLSTNLTRKCDRWVYKQDLYGSTIVTQYSWVCDLTLRKSHAQMMLMVGSLVGCFVFGPPSDVIGRKKMHLVGAFLHCVASISVAFANSFPVFALLYFLVGLSGPALWGIGFVIGVELVSSSKRIWTGIGVEFFWAFGCVVAVTAAYLVRNWQHLQLIVSVPTVVFLSYYWFMPESPRWLISKKKFKEADRILRHAAKVNKKTLPSDLFGGEVLNIEEQQPWWKMFTSSTLLIRSLIIFINWTVCSLGFYGLSLGVGNLGGNIYTNAYIGLAAEVVGYVACILLLDRVGRKAFHCTSIIMGGLCCTATIIPLLVKAQNLEWLSTAFALTGRGFVSASFAVIWLYTSELFPTVIRNSSLAVANVCARTGAAISPYIANLSLVIPGAFGRAVPLIIFGTSMLVAGLLALLLPETRDINLPETIQDAKQLKRTNVKVIGPKDDYLDRKELEEYVHLNSNTEDDNKL